MYLQGAGGLYAKIAHHPLQQATSGLVGEWHS